MQTLQKNSQQNTRDMVNAVPFWWHSIDVGSGVITPGHKTPAILKREWERMRMPNFRGKSVLDIYFDMKKLKGKAGQAAGFKTVEVMDGPGFLANFKLAALAKNILKRRKPSPIWRHRAVVQASKI